ncbi:unnamed protein product [Lactuca saligna]|uniref:Disease resistance protein Roq1-like winged-helix domain-containing protein n=1 Tax=Lactuca saligna TaxID=75948 RepID=A0AA35Z250_LACSI|nr:unnamed protein product [Lactuca saligna]
MYAFGRVIPNLWYKELSQRVVHYAARLPLTIKVLGSFLCDKSELEWIDVLERLKTIPLMETLGKLETSYISLENDYKEIFLNVACIMKGWSKPLAIKVLESCGFNARIGLRVLEQKSLITINERCGFHVGIRSRVLEPISHITINHDKYLGVHDHIEELGRHIIRHSHPDKPNKHSHLWNDEEIKDILTNDLGTQATRYIKFNMGKISPEIVMKGLRKMEELRFLDVSLPKTFQAFNLVPLEISDSRIIQLWEGGERKVLNKLRFLDLSHSKLRTIDLGLTPNLETLTLTNCSDLIKLRIPNRCLNLRSLKLNNSKLRTLDIRLTPNIEYLDLGKCYDLREFHIPSRCLEKLVYFNLVGCLSFRSFKYKIESDASYSEVESLKVVSLPELHLSVHAINVLCPFHHDNNFLKFRFACHYKEEQPLLTRNLEKLLSIGFCGCTNLDTFSRSICGLQLLRKLRN